MISQFFRNNIFLQSLFVYFLAFLFSQFLRTNFERKFLMRLFEVKKDPDKSGSKIQFGDVPLGYV